MRRMKPRRGQGIVEFALVITVLLLLLGGVLDLGQLLSDHLAVTYAARQAALSAVQAGTSSTADCAALAAVFVATQGQNGLRVTRIAIYQANSAGAPIGGYGTNGYADVFTGNPGCANPAAPPSPQPGNWLPASRTAPGLTLGVEIDYAYTWQTTFIASGAITITDHATMPLNP